jgi:ABC-type Fe3+-hydroxamate transport system substrate-binding protein
MKTTRQILFTFFLLQVFVLQGINPQRIVSLAPSLTKNIYYLNAENQLVGCTSYCTEALAENKEVVASAIKVNIEKTISLLPDLVIATTITSPETLETLMNFGIKVEVFPTPKNFDEICEQFLRMGEITGNSKSALKIITESKQKVNRLINSIDSIDSNQILFQIGSDPIFTVLPNTFMNDFISFTGGENIANDMKHGTLTREHVLAKNPDYIFIVSMGVVAEEEKNTWLNFKEISAAKTNNIYTVDADKACSPTPITFVETLDTIIKLMNNNHE